MKKLPDLLTWLLFIFIFGVSSQANAATVESVERLYQQGQSSMRNSNQSKVKALGTAIVFFRQALAELDAVESLTEAAKDGHYVKISSALFWASKFMPLGGSGKNNLPSTGLTRSESGGGRTANPKAPPVVVERKKDSADKTAYNQATYFAKRHPDKFADVATHFASVSASYPGTTYGERALKDAARWEKKVIAAAKRRAMMVPNRDERLAALDLTALLADYTDRIEKTPDQKILLDLQHGMSEVERFKQLLNWTAEITARLPEKIPTDELGVKASGFVRRVTDEGLVLYPGKDGRVPVVLWADAGSLALVRIASRLFRRNGKRALNVAVCSVLAKDMVLAFSMFELALLAGADTLATQEYFLLAQATYAKSAIGLVKEGMKQAKSLERGRDYAGSIRMLSGLIKSTRDDPAMASDYTKIVKWQRRLMRKYYLNKEGNPLSSAEKKIRRVFKCMDASYDEATGRVTLFYDFEDSSQLLDWYLPRGWSWKKGKLVSSATALRTRQNLASGSMPLIKQENMLAWTFPVKNVKMAVQLSHTKKGQPVLVGMGMRIRDPRRGFSQKLKAAYNARQQKVDAAKLLNRLRQQIIFRIFDNRASVNNGSGASQRMVFEPNAEHKFDICAGASSDLAPALWMDSTFSCGASAGTNMPFGSIGFAFFKQGGTVDNVYISADIDPKWFVPRSRGYGSD